MFTTSIHVLGPDCLFQMLARLKSSPVTLLFIVPLATTALWYVSSWLRSPLRKYPGPCIASWTNYWRVYHAYKGDLPVITKTLHDKYGPVVRMGPNYLDVEYPELIKTCFSTKTPWQKSKWHSIAGSKVGSEILYGLVSQTDTAKHMRLRAPIAKYFSSAGTAEFEPHMDANIVKLMRRLDSEFLDHDGMPKKPVNFDLWAMLFSWDCLGSISHGCESGYIDRGSDYDGAIRIAENTSVYFATFGMQPALDWWLVKNPIVRIGPPGFEPIVNRAMQALIGRVQGTDGHDPAKSDLVGHFLEARAEHPDAVSDGDVLTHMVLMLAAGADTVAHALKALLCLSLRDRLVWQRLEREVLAARPSWTQLPPPYAQARALPYLEAVVRETLRCVPIASFAQERVVPQEGLVFPDGRFAPVDTVVGFSPYAIHRTVHGGNIWGGSESRFSPDIFEPARWLRAEGEDTDAFAARLQAMNAADLSFSQGRRNCLGKNIALYEIVKLVATIVALFDVKLARPERELDIYWSFFANPRGVDLLLKRREDTKEVLEGMFGGY